MVAYINFNYNSPHEDVENCLGFNTDGSINVQYTLASLKNLLQENLEIVDELIANVDDIQTITPIGYNRIEIVTDTDVLLEKLLEKNIVCVRTNDEVEEIEDQMDELSDLNISEDETNNDRLNIINNLTNRNNIQVFSNDKNSDTEQDSDSDELIADEKNATSIINKYSDFIQNSQNTDSNNDSDSEYSDACSTEE